MKKVYVHPTAVVDKGAVIGDGTKVWHFVHVRENAEIGKGWKQSLKLRHIVYCQILHGNKRFCKT